MCTYDYTPYTGCEDGPQHYYIQWVKCSIAVEKGRYCSLDASHKVEQLRKLSANVLSCPLHGPIAVQQFVLDLANQIPLDDEAERSRARSTTRRAAALRGRTPKRGSDREVEQPARRPVRKQRSRREMAPESSDSESSSSFSARPRAADRVKMDDREAMERRRSRTAQAPSHTRSISADIAPPPPLPLFMRHGRSEVSLPLKTDFDVEAETPRGGPQQSRPKNSLDIPRAIGVVGLPSSPDMHRRGSVHRTRSESGLRPGNEGQHDPLPAPRSALSPASDSSPDQNPDLPFSTPGRRSRRAGTRSIRDRSVDTTMRRIDEHVENPSITARETATLETHSSTTTSPEPQTVTTTFHRRSNSRPHLNSLQIPKNRDQYQRDAYSAPTATPPETEINTTWSPPPKSRAKSLRHVDISPLAPLPPPPNLYTSSRNDGGDTASIRSTTTTRSRRFEDQVAEGRKWVAAREHMPMPMPRGAATDVLAHMSSMSDTNLPLAAAAAAAASSVPLLPLVGRGSVDSGYLSGHGHQPQRSWETVRSVDSVSASSSSVRGGGGGSGVVNGNFGKGGRNTLQKMPPQQQPGQGQGVGLGLVQGGGGQQQQQRPVPAPLNLSGLPPCALPVSLMSPGFQSDADGSPALKGPKGTLLQRMGLRRKFSGLVFKGGQREVGVEG